MKDKIYSKILCNLNEKSLCPLLIRYNQLYKKQEFSFKLKTDFF